MNVFWRRRPPAIIGSRPGGIGSGSESLAWDSLCPTWQYGARAVGPWAVLAMGEQPRHPAKTFTYCTTGNAPGLIQLRTLPQTASSRPMRSLTRHPWTQALLARLI